MTLLIRPASLIDLETILAWYEEIWRVEQVYEPRMLYPLKEYRQNLPQYLRNEKCLLLIAELDGKPAGYLDAHIDPSPDYLSGDDLECEIGLVYLEPWARGQGLAQRLIEQCKVWAQSKNVRRMKAGIFAQNHASLRTFRRCGFEDYHITLVRKLD